eukprot:2705005-Lingulodinium_polyedra.AAC.1
MRRARTRYARRPRQTRLFRKTTLSLSSSSLWPSIHCWPKRLQLLTKLTTQLCPRTRRRPHR